MRCHICNAQLSDSEVQWNTDHEDWDPCTTCQEAIDNVFNDDTESEINEQLILELDLEEDMERDDARGAEEAADGGEDESDG